MKFGKILNSLPSIIWVIIIPLCIAGFIGGIILTFYLLANKEGFASVLMIIVALGVMKFSMSPPKLSNVEKKKEPGTAFAIAVGICFFALMGMSIDQPGNILYNKPLEIFFCPDATHLSRGIDVLHPTPGRTDIIQAFTCYDDDGKTVKQLDMFPIIIVRFVEYVIIGYILIYITNLINWIQLQRLLRKLPKDEPQNKGQIQHRK